MVIFQLYTNHHQCRPGGKNTQNLVCFHSAALHVSSICSPHCLTSTRFCIPLTALQCLLWPYLLWPVTVCKPYHSPVLPWWQGPPQELSLKGMAEWPMTEVVTETCITYVGKLRALLHARDHPSPLVAWHFKALHFLAITLTS